MPAGDDETPAYLQGKRRPTQEWAQRRQALPWQEQALHAAFVHDGEPRDLLQGVRLCHSTSSKAGQGWGKEDPTWEEVVTAAARVT